jgi:hypothetical protein
MFKSILSFLAVLILMFSCNTSDSTDKPITSRQTLLVNKSAPFYTHEIPDGHPRVSKLYDTAKIERFGPFIVYKDGSYMISAEVEMDSALIPYITFFQKYNAGGSGDNWAGLLKIALGAENPSLLKRLDLDPETGGFYAFADGEESQRQFAEFGLNLFADSLRMIKYITGPDKDKIINYDPRN